MKRMRIFMGLFAGVAFGLIIWAGSELSSTFQSRVLASIIGLLGTALLCLLTKDLVSRPPPHRSAKSLAMVWSLLGAGQFALAMVSDKMFAFALAGGSLGLAIIWFLESRRVQHEVPQ